ncbi:MAG: 2Fe-2S iron-sulfur cluster binding domain-containing protein [Flavobacteriales bacterium]|nr:2Fe-2S iron-sulfur cluster binding domain-containing protein [Flavobacteriales bacterium]MBT5090198.1 2Fe-2S iron-sulfur cluster binding domain-containing protein [Flavobacteriales bacterium]MBT5749883.1 2Fe-2S iron-sulfur cluster binding domain-containing protein [Flavobacteriales bacterium]
MNKFHPLTIISVVRLTPDAVAISFDVSNNVLFQFEAGQYITIKKDIDGEEVRRAYSICSMNTEGVTIGVKKVETGKMSTFLTESVKQGDVLQVMPPSGNFVINGNNKHIVGICAGSGVTPIISMIKTELAKQSDVKFTLIYGNKTKDSSMFAEELQQLQIDNSDRLKIHNAYSRQGVAGAINGRLDKNTIQQLLNTFIPLKTADAYFICGPGELIDNANELLLLNNITQKKINFERFTTVEKRNITDNDSDEIISNVRVSVDGEDFEFTLSNKGQTILDAAMQQGADVPFSCKGAVCCTCRAKVMEGSVTMDANYSLSEDEVAEGYVLGCQARPASVNLVIDFDEM